MAGFQQVTAWRKLDVKTGAKFELKGTEVTPTAAELNYSSGVTSAIQTQLDAKAVLTSVNVASVDISSAELLALYTTPKTLVAAPGAGKILELLSVLLALDYATTAYTIGTAGDMQVKYTDASGAAASSTRAATGYLDAVADTLSLLEKVGGTVVPVANASLVLCLATANVTAGDSPIHAKVVYRILNTGL